MLYGYFALSGIQEDSPSCCLSGFISETDDLSEFDHAWKSLLADSSHGLNAADCLQDIGNFQFWDIARRDAMIAGLSEILSRFALVTVGTLVVREDFSHLSSAERLILSAEGIESPLDLIFYDWTERMINIVHEHSEKISLIFCRDSQAEQYRALFDKHLSRYLLGTHLTTDLAFAEFCDHSHLQAAKLLGETALFIETSKRLQHEATALPISQGSQQVTDQMLQQGRFDAAELRRLAARLKGTSQKWIK